jgi:hypothetical protein
VLNDLATLVVAAVIVVVVATILGAVEWIRKTFGRDVTRRPSGMTS